MADSELEIKTRELITLLQKNRRSTDWESRMRMFAGNDSRILRRIPLIRRKVAVETSLERHLQDFLEQNDTINQELG